MSYLLACKFEKISFVKIWIKICSERTEFSAEKIL